MNHPNNPGESLSTSYAPINGQEPGGYGQQAQAAAAAALGQPQPGASNTASVNGRKRKASGAPGSRGVANLTPEQLAKKRANDREAQRAIRERTKNTIETLETRIRELESQQPFQELQRVVAERDRALAECEELKGRLTQIAGIVGTGNPRLNGELSLDDLLDLTMLTEAGTELASLTAQQTPLPPLTQQQHHSPQYSALSAAATPYEQQHLHPDLRSPNASTLASPASQASTAGAGYAANESTLRRWSPSMEHQSNQQYYHSRQSSGLQPQESRHQPPAPQMQQQSNGDRLGLNFLLDSTQHSKDAPIDQPTALAYTSSQGQEQPLYARLPNNTASSCPLDSLLLDMVNSSRQKLAAGIPMHEVLGPEYPSLLAWYDPKSPQRQDSHPVSAMLIDVISKFPDICMLPERVAALYIMFLIMRWYICPCELCFERMPAWARPIAEQYDRPHGIWIDFLPWPGMRRGLVVSNVTFEDFSMLYTTFLSVNWPYPSDQVLIRTESSSSSSSNANDSTLSVKMNPVFETHVLNINHWSVGKAFAHAHPNLVEGVRVEDPQR